MEVSNIRLNQLESVVKACNKRAASSQQLLRFPGGPAADERVDILEPHLLQHPGSKRRAIAASAIKNQLAILVGGDLIYVAFKHPTRNVLCAGNGAALHFVGLMHIDQFEVLAALLHGLKRRDIDLLNLTLGFIAELIKFRHRHSGPSGKTRDSIRALPSAANFKSKSYNSRR